MRPTSTPPCGAGLNAIRASTSTSPRPPGSTWSSACSPISPVVVCVGDAFAVSPNSNQRSDATLTTATPLPNRSFGPKGPTPSFENTNGLNGTLFRGRDTRVCLQSSKPEKNRSDSNHGEIVGGTLFVPCGDSSKVFQPVDQALDDVALAVCLAVEAGLAALLIGITGMMPRFRRASRMLRLL